MLKQIILSFTVLQFFVLAPAQAQAAQIQPSDFPVCASPEGSVKSQYSSGTHGIPGSSATYQGSDTVYQLSKDKLTQCFCAVDGSGIQTNWLKVSDLSDEEIDQYKDAGWIFIQNGANWGLDDTAYLSYNSTYACSGSATGGTGESVLGASANGVLGFASTGNIKILLALTGIGLTALLLGLKLRKL